MKNTFKVADIVRNKAFKEVGEVIKIEKFYPSCFIWDNWASGLRPWQRYYLITVQFLDGVIMTSFPEEWELIVRDE